MLRQKFIIYIFIIGIFLPQAYVFAGAIVDPYKYAWGSNIGYINFERLIVNDTNLSGYAWSANAGWIKFDTAEGGVLNDGTGNLSGYAWGANLGWIDFDGVSINSDTGKFSGTAIGEVSGTITFDCNYCDVRTDWRKATSSKSGSYNTNYYPRPVAQSPSSTVPSPINRDIPNLKTNKKIDNLSLPLNSKVSLNNDKKENTKNSIKESVKIISKSIKEKVNSVFESIIIIIINFFKNFIEKLKLLLIF